MEGGVGKIPYVRKHLEEAFVDTSPIIFAELYVKHVVCSVDHSHVRHSSINAVAYGAVLLHTGDVKLSTDPLESPNQPLLHNARDISEEVSPTAPLSLPQSSLDRASLKMEQKNLQLAMEHTIAPISADDNKNRHEIYELGNPDVLRLIMSWDATVSHVHGEEAAELATKMHNVDYQYSYVAAMRSHHYSSAPGPVLSRPEAICGSTEEAARPLLAHRRAPFVLLEERRRTQSK